MVSDRLRFIHAQGFGDSSPESLEIELAYLIVLLEMVAMK